MIKYRLTNGMSLSELNNLYDRYNIDISPYRPPAIQIRVPYITSETRVPTPSEVESFRKATKRAYKKYLACAASVKRQIDGILDNSPDNPMLRYDRSLLDFVLNNMNDPDWIRIKNPRRYNVRYLEHMESNFDNFLSQTSRDSRREGWQNSLNLLEKNKRLANNRMDFFYVVLAKLSCRQLTAEVATRLPREVRDLVYTFLLDKYNAKYPCWRPRDQISVSETAYVVDSFGPLSTTHPSFPPPICREGIRPYQHCWSRESCVAPFIEELAEMCYSEYTFEISQTHLLPRFLGLDSPTAYSSNPDINFLPWKYVNKVVFAVPKAAFYVEKLLEDIPALLKLRRKATIDINVHIEYPARDGIQDTVDNMLEIHEVVFRSLASLQDCGHQVTLHLKTPDEYRWDVKAGVRSRMSLVEMERLVEERLGMHLTFACNV